MSVTWTGIPELHRSLDDIVERMQRAARSAVADAAHALQVDAQGRAPRQSGGLAASIRVRGPQGSGTRYDAAVGPSVPYGHRVEAGFHGTDALGRQFAQDGHPYMAPAVQASRRRISDIFSRAWRGAL